MPQQREEKRTGEIFFTRHKERTGQQNDGGYGKQLLAKKKDEARNGPVK